MRDFLDRAPLHIPCPRCGYIVEVTFLQIRLEERVLCPCCKSYIKLIDSGASNEAARRDVNAGLADLENTIKDINLSFKL